MNTVPDNFQAKIEGRVLQTVSLKYFPLYYLKSLCKLYPELFLAFVWVIWVFQWQPVACRDCDVFPKHVLFDFMPLCKCLTVPESPPKYISRLQRGREKSTPGYYFAITKFPDYYFAILSHLQIVPQVGGPPVTLPSPGISHLCNEGGRTRQDPGLELPWSNINLFFSRLF